MTMTRRDGLRIIGAATAAAAIGVPMRAAAEGTVHEVLMLNRDPDSREPMVFSPAVVRAMPGDTIRFVPEDRGHSVQSEEEMLPEGAEGWASKINEEFDVVVEAEGAYGYICKPHYTTGMVGLILVGNVDNLDALKEVRHRGRAAKRFEQYFAEAEEILSNETS